VARTELSNAVPFDRSIGEIKAKINWGASPRKTLYKRLQIRPDPWRIALPAKINAAQASHPGRMLVDVLFALSLPDAVRRLRETAFAEERSFLGAPFKSSIRGPEPTLDDLQ
jgi:hypothetical protein